MKPDFWLAPGVLFSLALTTTVVTFLLLETWDLLTDWWRKR